jgi:hypothetical protein
MIVLQSLRRLLKGGKLVAMTAAWLCFVTSIVAKDNP